MSLRESLVASSVNPPPEIEGAITAPDWLPPEFASLFEQVMREMPAFPDRHTAAAVWSALVHRCAHKTLQRVPLLTRRLNGRACFERREFVEYGFRRLVESPAVRRGRRNSDQPSEQQAG